MKSQSSQKNEPARVRNMPRAGQSRLMFRGLAAAFGNRFDCHDGLVGRKQLSSDVLLYVLEAVQQIATLEIDAGVCEIGLNLCEDVEGARLFEIGQHHFLDIIVEFAMLETELGSCPNPEEVIAPRVQLIACPDFQFVSVHFETSASHQPINRLCQARIPIENALASNSFSLSFSAVPIVCVIFWRKSD
ncbi:hypothetical protein [Oricola indica]|uniref:hypothetical protein n=1 Tax=Oricola indica TaxID=2872591 RepID=UPI003CCC28F2